MRQVQPKTSSPILPLTLIFIFDFIVFFPFLFTTFPETVGAETGDLAIFFKPMREYAVSQLNEGRLPFWNPYTSGGRPFLADPEMGLFYPFTYLFTFLPTHLAFSWSYFIHYLIAGWGMVFLSRSLNVSPWGAAVSALVFSWSAPHLLHMYAGHFTMIQTFAWTPWLVWGLERFLVTLAWRYAALPGIFLGLHLLGGFPLYTYLTGWFLLAHGFFSVAKRNLWSRYRAILVRLGTGLLLGAGLFLTQAFLTYELVQHSTRSSNDFSFTASYALTKKNLVTLLAPYYFGESSDVFHDERSYFGSTFIWENSAYMGMAGLILALAACGRWRESQTRFWATAFLLALAISTGPLTPLFKFCYQWLPGFSLFRGYSKALTISALALAILAGMGLDQARKNPQNPWAKFGAYGLSISLFFFWLLGCIYPDFLPFWKKALSLKLQDWGMTPDAGLNNLYFSILGKSLFTSALVAMLIAAARAFYSARRISSSFLGCALFLITAGDFYLFSIPFMNGMNFKSYSISDELFAPLRSRAYPGRIFWNDSLIANLSLPHRVFSVAGYENFPLREYSKLVSHLNGNRLDSKNPYLEVNANNLTMKFLGGNFIVSRPNPKTPPGFIKLGQATVANIHHHLYKAPDEWPRYHIVHKPIPVNVDKNPVSQTPERYRQVALEVVQGIYKAIYISPKDYAAVTRPGARPPLAGVSEFITPLVESPGLSRLRVHMTSPGFLVLNENYYPGWRARVDGAEAKVFPANLVMKAVFVSAGDHELEFFFVPTHFRLLATISLASLAGLLFLIAVNPKPPGRLDDPSAL